MLYPFLSCRTCLQDIVYFFNLLQAPPPPRQDDSRSTSLTETASTDPNLISPDAARLRVEGRGRFGNATYVPGSRRTYLTCGLLCPIGCYQRSLCLVVAAAATHSRLACFPVFQEMHVSTPKPYLVSPNPWMACLFGRELLVRIGVGGIADEGELQRAPGW